jgi:hypothetical protein
MMPSVASAVFILIAYVYSEADSLFLRATQYPLREERVMARESRTDALDLGKNPFREGGLAGVGHIWSSAAGREFIYFAEGV